MEFLFVSIVGLVAGAVSGVIGTGASYLLLPVLTYEFGPKEAVPIMAVAGVMANLARVMSWWRDIDWRACAAYAVTGVTAAALGARTVVVLPPHIVALCIGLFFLIMIPARRWLVWREFKVTLWQLALVGVVVGYLTGMAISSGPITVPVFLSYGLVKGGFIGTEAAASFLVDISRALTFQSFGVLPLPVAIKGVIAGSALMAGTFLAKRIVLRLGADTFRWLLEGLMLFAGLAMLWNAFADWPAV